MAFAFWLGVCFASRDLILCVSFTLCFAWFCSLVVGCCSLVLVVWIGLIAC